MEQLLAGLFGTKDHLGTGQECLRALVVFAYGLLILRLSGRRTFAKWSSLDIIVSIVVGSSLSRIITGDAPFAGTVAAIAVLVALHLIVSFAISCSPAAARLIEGEAVIIVRDGKVDEAQRRRHLISIPDLFAALRQRGVETPEQAKSVTLEPGGRLTVVRKQG